MTAIEHVLLESDERNLPQRCTARKVHVRHRFYSRLRRCVVELEIIDFYYLCCRATRARHGVCEYILDLRFIDPGIRQSRHVPARLLALAIGFGALALAILRWTESSPARSHAHVGLPVGALLLGLAAGAATAAIYRLTETIRLHSVHGQVELLELTGGPGTLRSLRPFILKLSAHLRIAAAARRHSRTAHLRDEMREHRRLYEAGVLSDEQYEESKRRILAHHLPARATAGSAPLSTGCR